MEPIYYTKVEFRESLGFSEYASGSILLLNLVNKELSYQKYKQKQSGVPIIMGEKTEEFNGKQFIYPFFKNAAIMKNNKIGFDGKLISTEGIDHEIVYSIGIKIADDDMEELLTYCNALDFEPYRDRKMSMSDEGYIGYRDEVNLCFTGITDSHLPRLDISMDYYYDEDHIWPTEKLYRYLV